MFTFYRQFQLFCQLFLPKVLRKKIFWHFWTKSSFFVTVCKVYVGDLWRLKILTKILSYERNFPSRTSSSRKKRRKFNFHLVLMSLRLLRFQSCFSSDILTYFCFNLWFLIQEFMPASPSNSLLWNDEPQCLNVESKSLILKIIDKNCRSKSIKIYEFIFIDLNYFD